MTALVLAGMAAQMGGMPDARAQDKLPPAQVEQARTYYKEGQTALKEGRYTAAVEAFIDAYEITKDPKLFFHVARAQELGGNKVEALVFYRRYLNEVELSVKGRKEVEAKIQTLERETSAKSQETPDEPPIMKPEVETVPEAEPGTGTGTGTGADTTEEAPVAREVEDSGGVKVVEEPAPFVEEPDAGWYGTAAWITLGVAGVATASGVFFAAAAESSEDDARRLASYRDEDNLPSAYQGSVREQYEEAVDEGEKFDTWAWIAYSSAGVLAGTAMVLFILDANDGEDVQGTSTAGWKPTVTPQVGPGTTAFSASWRF